MSFLRSPNPQIFAVCLLVLVSAVSARAQSGNGTLRGQVTDPSGSAITTAKVTVTWPNGKVTTADTVHDGRFEITGLPPGKYGVAVTAKGFAPFEVLDYEITAGEAERLNVTLSLQAQQEKVIVQSTSPTVEVSPEQNAGAIVMTQKDLDALSDDPDELESDLEALAGPSAGPNGGQIYIDGFTAGQLPPKSAIREIRINQNPFSPEFDKLGYGRIEIFTKPGMDQLHGNFELQGNDSSFNSKNPFASSEPGYYSTLFNGNIGGPISKKASFYLYSQYRNINDVNIIHAADPSGSGATVTQSVPSPRTRVNVGPRLDYQVTPTNTLTVRYQYYRDDLSNQGVGGFNLASQAYDSLSTEHTLQIGDTQVFGTKIVNETRFQFLHAPFTQTPVSVASTIVVPGCDSSTGGVVLPTIVVGGAFVCGGSSSGTIRQTQNHYEFQNYTQIALRKHTIKFGGRLREVTDEENATSGMNGTFYFSSIAAFQSGLPTQFTANFGIPVTRDSLFDGGFYVGDDWKVRPNITLSGGLRLETQTSISNHVDWAPRLAAAWGIGRGKSTPKTVLRAGVGIFYDRFTENLLLEARRFNGLNQLRCVYSTPSFYSATFQIEPGTQPPPSACPDTLSGMASPGGLSTTYQISPNLRAPGVLQSAVVLERQLTKVTSLSLTYLNSRGFDQLYTNNICTPAFGTYHSLCPVSTPQNLYEYESEGVFRQNQFFAQVTIRAGARLTLFSNYVLNFAKSDTSGPSSFPSNPFDIQQDYGRASFDYRNRFFMGGSIGLPRGFRLSPFMIVSAGQPYSITLNQDLIGSSQFNQRPAPAPAGSCPTAPGTGSAIVCTPFGAFNTQPALDQPRIPVNSLTGPARFTMNLRVSKTWGFGALPERAGGNFPGGGGGPRGDHGRFGGLFGAAPTNKRYNLTLSVTARNVFNYTNLATPSAALVGPEGTTNAAESPFFAQPNQLAFGPFSSQAASRLLYLQLGFSF